MSSAGRQTCINRIGILRVLPFDAKHGGTVTPEERKHMDYLCKRIAVEKDPRIFEELVKQLNELLGRKQERIHPEHKS